MAISKGRRDAAGEVLKEMEGERQRETARAERTEAALATANAEVERLRGWAEQLRRDQQRSCELLALAYHAFHRQGWEDGPSVGEVQEQINDHLANLEWPGTPGTGATEGE